MTLNEIFEKYPDDMFLKADGFDDAVIGVTDDKILIYSVEKCIDILCENMSREEANEYFHFNVAGAYFGKRTPIFENEQSQEPI